MNASLAHGDAGGNLRRSALLLHGLGETDRAWLLQRLDVSHREQLSTLLDELRTLGIPADAGLAFPASALCPAEQPRTPHSIVSEAAPAQLSAALKDEPLGLVARLLTVAGWNWKAGFMALQSPAQRRQIQELLGAGRPGPRLAEALVQEVAERLTEVSTAAQQRRAQAPWKEWLASFLTRAREIGTVR